MFHFLPCCVCGTWTGTNRFSYCLAACWRNCRSRWAGVKLSPLACQKGDLTNKNLENKESTRKHHHGMMLCKLRVEKSNFPIPGWVSRLSPRRLDGQQVSFGNSLRWYRFLGSVGQQPLSVKEPNFWFEYRKGRLIYCICLYKFGHRFGGFHESFLFPFAFKHPGSNALKSVNFHGATARFSRHDFTKFHSRCNWDFYTLVN